MLRMLSRLAIGLTVGALLVSSLSFEAPPAYAQQRHAKKRVEKRPPPPPAKEPAAERTPFTAEDDASVVVLGLPDARAWGDSETEFARMLPKASGPWLAISGGGADGAFGAGLLNGWSASGTRPEFAVVTGRQHRVVDRAVRVSWLKP